MAPPRARSPIGPAAEDVVLRDLHLEGEARPQSRYDAAQRISCSILLVMAAIV